jgi:formylglycine-generating enzyme required for sulfatase activity
MSGGVWEWTADWYDALYYRDHRRDNPRGPDEGVERVLRGGSWADCAEVVTVSFRMSRGSIPYWKGIWGQHEAPNIGFRLCRVGPVEPASR